tara:strand:- start:11818 stop:12696 length:879 start_codon:yes stop_codon:yes gene_type:complete
LRGPEAGTDDLDLLIDAALASGEIARGFAQRGYQTWEKADDQGPVTEADLAVNTMLHRELGAARPHYGWLSEESPDHDARLSQDRVFIIDPIDGTRAFVNGRETWAHSLAVATGGRITAAVVYLPMKDRLYAAAAGRGATLNGVPILCTAQSQLSGATVLAARPNFDAANWRQTVPDFDRVYRPSLAYRLSLVGQGRFDAMLTLRPSWEWDIAAGSLIVEESGAIASDRIGGPLRFNNPRPLLNGVIAAGPVLHEKMVAELAPRRPRNIDAAPHGAPTDRPLGAPGLPPRRE